MYDVIRSHSKSLVEVKGFGCRQKSCDIVFCLFFFVFVFFSLPIQLIFCPPQRGPTMTNKDLVLLVISLIMSMFSSSESRVLNRDFACKIDGYTHVRVQQTFTEPQRLQGSCQLEGGSVSFFWSLFSLDK